MLTPKKKARTATSAEFGTPPFGTPPKKTRYGTPSNIDAGRPTMSSPSIATVFITKGLCEKTNLAPNAYRNVNIQQTLGGRPNSPVTPVNNVTIRGGGCVHTEPYSEQGDLLRLLQQPGVTKRVIHIASRNMFQAIDMINSEGYIHGDVTSTNLVIDKRGIVTLTDFAQSLTKTGEGYDTDYGTADYLDPKSTQGWDPVATTDVDIGAGAQVLMDMISITQRQKGFKLTTDHLDPSTWQVAMDGFFEHPESKERLEMLGEPLGNLLKALVYECSHPVNVRPSAQSIYERISAIPLSD
jgi:serine/threonine protein kinase